MQLIDQCMCSVLVHYWQKSKSYKHQSYFCRCEFHYFEYNGKINAAIYQKVVVLS